MEAILTNIVAAVNDVLWNKYLVLLFLLLGSGIYFTIRTGFVQVRKFGEGMRLVFGNISLKGKEAGKDGMSSFQALATAIAAQVGTGNIAGCASALAQAAFNNSFGSFGNAFVAICLLFFAFSTIVGWYFFGESNVKALFKGSEKATFIYGVIALVFIVVGSFQKVTLVWDMSDMFNGLMVIPNLLAVLALSGIVAKFAKDDTYLGKD